MLQCCYCCCCYSCWYCCCCSGGVTSLCCRLLVCPTKLFHLLENASIIKKLLGWFTWQTRPRPQLFSIWVSATVSVCVCVAWKEIRNFFANNSICENKRAYAQNIRTVQQQQRKKKNEKEMKWIEKIEKFYLLQVLLSYSICLPLFSLPLTDCFVAVWQGGKRQLQVAATSSGNGNGNDLLLFSQRKRNKNPCRGVCVPCRTV